MTKIAKAGAGGEIARVGVETLAEAYLWLQEVRASHASFLVARAEKVSALDARARYVLGSLESARRFLGDSSAAGDAGADSDHTEKLRDEARSPSGEDGGQASLSGLPATSQADDPLVEMVERTRAELEEARRALDEWAAERASHFEEAFAAAEEAVLERVEAYAEHHLPRVRLEVARVGGDRCIVHLPRPEDDEAVILCHVFTGRPPSRHDFIRDDSVDQVDGPVHLFVREYGVDPEAITAGGPEAEEAVVREAGHRLLPLRAHLPVLLPGISWPRLRLVGRGPVLELEAREEGEAYTHILSAQHCELFTGYLLSLRARSLLDVDIHVP